MPHIESPQDARKGAFPLPTKASVVLGSSKRVIRYKELRSIAIVCSLEIAGISAINDFPAINRMQQANHPRNSRLAHFWWTIEHNEIVPSEDIPCLFVGLSTYENRRQPLSCCNSVSTSISYIGS